MAENAVSPVFPGNLPYRPCVGIMLVNQNNHVFVAKRLDMLSEAWQMPQGGIDEGEEPLVAAMRELYEETSIKSIKLIAETDDWLPYDLPIELIPQLWDGRFRGQKQKWFLMRFTGEESEINLETDHAEFSEWKWMQMQRIPDQIVPFKRAIYVRLVNEFGPLADAAVN